MNGKERIVEENGVFRYFDKNGVELHEGDVVFLDGKERKLFLTTKQELGVDATNPFWISTGRAIPCEYGIYPLTISDLKNLYKIQVV